MLIIGQIRTKLHAGSIRGGELDSLWFFAPLSLAAALVLLLLTFASPAHASGDVNTATCPNEANTGFSSALPDCRAYEQVSPPFKNGFALALEEVLSGGERVKAESFGNVAGTTAIPNCVDNTYDLFRTDAGWVTTAINDVPQSQFAYATHHCAYPLLDDAGTSLLQLHPTANSKYERDLYLHEADGAFVPVGPMLPPSAVPPTPTGGGEQVGIPGAEFVAVTPTFSDILFETQALDEEETNEAGIGTVLWPGDTTTLGLAANPQFQDDGIYSLYEYVGTGNTRPSLVGVDNSGRLIGDCGTVAGSYSDEVGNRSNVMSSDGSRVFFTAVGLGDPPDERCAGAERIPPVDELFARINGGQPQSPVDAQGRCTVATDACTVAISQPATLSPLLPNEGCTSSTECVANTSPANANADWRDANFEKASRDGSKVFFSSTQQLLDGATQDSNPNDSAVRREEAKKGCARTFGADGCNLYEYDFNEPEGRRLILVSGGDSSGLGPEVQGVSAVSEDGSHVYFVAKGVLTKTPNEYGHEAVAGEDNLYVRDTVSGETKFVATLSSSDSEQWTLDDGGTPMNVTDDGRFLVFTSVNQLTAGDTSTVQQVFRFDAATGALVRLSLGDQGSAGGIGAATVSTTHYAVVDAVNRDAHPAESEDGSVVVFASSEALLPEAFSNLCIREEAGKCFEYSQNIYEYRAGSLYLIGHGTGDSEPEIGEAGSRDIFFQSNEALVPQDADTLTDIYDAREDGGFPAQPVVSCSGESCQGTSPAAPAFGEPASASLTGSGNLTPAAPVVAPKPKPKAKPLTRAQKLTNALRTCRQKRKQARTSCEGAARRKYGPKAKKASRQGRASS